MERAIQKLSIVFIVVVRKGIYLLRRVKTKGFVDAIVVMFPVGCSCLDQLSYKFFLLLLGAVCEGLVLRSSPLSFAGRLSASCFTSSVAKAEGSSATMSQGKGIGQTFDLLRRHYFR